MMPEGTILMSTGDTGENKEKTLPTGEVGTTSVRRSVSWPAVVIISLLMSVLSVFLYDKFFAQKIIAVDMKGYIARQRDLYMEGKLTDEQFRAGVDRLEEAVKSIPENRVAIMADVVLKNAEQKQLP
jgi:hypothetical protein